MYVKLTPCNRQRRIEQVPKVKGKENEIKETICPSTTPPPPPKIKREERKKEKRGKKRKEKKEAKSIEEKQKRYQ